MITEDELAEYIERMGAIKTLPPRADLKRFARLLNERGLSLPQSPVHNSEHQEFAEFDNCLTLFLTERNPSLRKTQRAHQNRNVVGIRPPKP